MTINLNQARKLAELGVEVCTRLLFRVDSRGCTTINGYAGGEPNKTARYPQMGVSILEAYNAEELLGMMKGQKLSIYKTDSDWCCYDSSVYPFISHYGATLTEALGNKLIHDLENGVVTVEEVNK